MTTPHPTPEEGMTPEERYEALCRVFEHTGHALAGFQADAVMKSIREAEAAGEARGRAMERERIKDALDFRLNDYLCEMREGYDDSIVGFNEAWDVVRKYFKSIRARTDKESSDD